MRRLFIKRVERFSVDLFLLEILDDRFQSLDSSFHLIGCERLLRDNFIELFVHALQMRDGNLKRLQSLIRVAHHDLMSAKERNA